MLSFALLYGFGRPSCTLSFTSAAGCSFLLLLYSWYCAYYSSVTSVAYSFLRRPVSSCERFGPQHILFLHVADRWERTGSTYFLLLGVRAFG